MNATFLILSTAWMAGADATPAPLMAPPVAPVVVGSAGCSGCGATAPSYGYSTASSYGHSSECCDSAGSGAAPRMGFFSRIKSKLGCKKSASNCAAPVDYCAPAPVACAPAPVACAPVAYAPAACAPAPIACAPSCGTPVYTGFTTSSCSSSKCCLFGRMKSKMKNSGGASGGCDTCGSASTYGAASTYGSSYGPTVAPCSVGPAMVAPVNPVVPPREMPPPIKEDPKKTTQAPFSPSDSLRIPELGGTAGKY